MLVSVEDSTLKPLTGMDVTRRLPCHSLGNYSRDHSEVKRHVGMINAATVKSRPTASIQDGSAILTHLGFKTILVLSERRNEY